MENISAIAGGVPAAKKDESSDTLLPKLMRYGFYADVADDFLKRRDEPIASFFPFVK